MQLRPIQIVAMLLAGTMMQARAQWYVATNGLNSAGTNWVTAFTNLQNALNTAAPDDVVRVAGHTFITGNTINWTSRASRVTIQGGYAATNPSALPGARDAVAWPTVMRKTGPGRLLWMRGVTNGVLDSLTLTGGDAAVNGAGLYVESSTGILLRTCIFSGNQTTASGGGFALQGSWCTASNCLVRGNTVNNYGGAVYVHNDAFLLCLDSVLRENSAGGYGSACMNYGIARFRNCLISNNGGMGQAALSQYAGTMELTGCTIADNGRAGIYLTAGLLTLTNCIVWNNIDDLAGNPPTRLVNSNVEDGDGKGLNGCISAPPLFRSGYYLATNSPCVNAGTNTPSAWGVDGRTTRTDGLADTGRVDIGYHYVGGPGTAYSHLYVATNGNDTVNTGTNIAAPFRTIGKALALARDATQIHVGAGRYTNGLESFPLRLTGRCGVELLGAGHAATVIDARGANQSVLIVSNAARAVVSSLTIAGGNRTGSGGRGGGVFSICGGGLLMKDCMITSNATSYAGGGLCTAYSPCRLSNVVVNANHSGERGGGLYVDEGGEVFCEDSILTENTSATYGRVMMNYGPAIFRNVLIHNNGGGGDAAFSQYAVTTLQFLNCTIANNTDVGIYRVNGTVSLTNCILWANGNDVDGTVNLAYCTIEDGDNIGLNGCISAPPLFRSGYYLATNSPCVNAGTNTPSAWGVDGRTTRTDGLADTGRVDIGYHYVGGPGTAYSHLYVATNGNDTLNTGTNIAAPFRTIGKALALARDATQIHVGAGRYTNGLESFPLRLTGRCGVELLGAGHAATVIDAGGANRNVLIVSNAAQAVIRDLTLARGNTSGHGGGIYAIRGGGISLADCEISSNQAAANGGGMSLWGSSGSVSNCLITANTGSWGGGFFVDEGASLSCEDSLATLNNAGGYGRICMNYGPSIFHNVLMHGNAGAGEAAFSQYGNSILIRNCTFVNNGPVGINRGGGTATVLNSILWGNGDEVGGTVSLMYTDIEDGDTGPGCISADPAFDLDFYLATNSPCVDSGTNPAAFWGLADRTTWKTGGADTGRVNMGYHYFSGLTLSYPDLYVATNGNDVINTGTNAASPFRTIGKALAVAQTGTRVHIGAGNFISAQENYPLVISGKSDVQLLGAGRDLTHINANGGGARVLTILNAAYTTIRDLTCRGGTAADNGGGINVTESAGLQLLNTAVIMNQATSQGAGLYLKGSSCVISGCVVSANSGNWGGAFFVDSDASLVCKESVITLNTATSYGRVCMNYGPTLYRNVLVRDNAGAGEAAFSQYGNGLQFESCTLVSNGTVGVRCNAGTVTMANSIVWGHGDDLSGNISLRYSDIEDGDNAGNDGCVSMDPLFADAVYCHLQSRSGQYEGNYFSGGTWGRSSINSPLLDIGDPMSDYSREPFSSGDRINIGYDGNTPVASRSMVSGTFLTVK